VHSSSRLLQEIIHGGAGKTFMGPSFRLKSGQVIETDYYFYQRQK